MKMLFILRYEKHGRGWVPWGLYKTLPDNLPLNHKIIELYTDLWATSDNTNRNDGL